MLEEKCDTENEKAKQSKERYDMYLYKVTTKLQYNKVDSNITLIPHSLSGSNRQKEKIDYYLKYNKVVKYYNISYTISLVIIFVEAGLIPH